MIVYRLCRESEINELLNTKSTTNIGKEYISNPKQNNHNYKDNIKYLHFYKDYDSLFYLYLKPNRYICTYNIPDELLQKYQGTGFYLDRIFLEKLESTTEYAVPNNEISFSYLQKVDKIKEEIEFEDYICGGHHDSLETIYDTSQKQYAKKNTNQS